MKKLIWMVAAPWLAITLQAQVTNFVPVFQFSVFYYQDQLEINPGPNFTVSGPVQANLNIYADPSQSLTFLAAVNAGGGIYAGESPADPTIRSTPGPIIFDVPAVSNAVPYLLPGDRYATNGYALLQVPPLGESPVSVLGTNRLFNRADMIVMISNNNAIFVSSGVSINHQATVISSNQWGNFIGTNGAFYDQRDAFQVNPVVLNVSNLVAWSATNTVLRPLLQAARGSGAADVQSVYLADLRDMSDTVVTTNTTVGTNYTTNQMTSPDPPAPGTYLPPITTNGSPGHYTYTYNVRMGAAYTNYTYLTNDYLNAQPGLVLSNGATLPPQGLAIVTPDPVYIVGNWNVATNSAHSDAGASDTAYTYPSAIFGDAITVLSGAWNPSNSAASIGSRLASTDTVNAAFFAGDVPSDGAHYSGGLENFIRLAENWSGVSLFWNGSICCMFDSQIAAAPWPGTGTVYNPPARIWAFDSNFTNAAKLPPLTPVVKQSVMLAPDIQAATPTNGTILLSWSTLPSVSYTIQYTTNLLRPNWQFLESFLGTGMAESLVDAATNAQRFYRLQAYP
ncbi:MAG TPA: hypothetical protein VFC44_17495 [Candidatus Saccharimonadales bacterium]|nr:hypothetical protein [Candidatus Saccharimonadales bacterium]